MSHFFARILFLARTGRPAGLGQNLPMPGSTEWWPDPAALTLKGRLLKDRARISASNERASLFLQSAKAYADAAKLTPTATRSSMRQRCRCSQASIAKWRCSHARFFIFKKVVQGPAKRLTGTRLRAPRRYYCWVIGRTLKQRLRLRFAIPQWRGKTMPPACGSSAKYRLH